MGLLMDYLTGGKNHQKDDDLYELTSHDKIAIKVANEKAQEMRWPNNHRIVFYAYCTECGRKSHSDNDINGDVYYTLESSPKYAIERLQCQSLGCGRGNHIARVAVVDSGKCN